MEYLETTLKNQPKNTGQLFNLGIGLLEAAQFEVKVKMTIVDLAIGTHSKQTKIGERKFQYINNRISRSQKLH